MKIVADGPPPPNTHTMAPEAYYYWGGGETHGFSSVQGKHAFCSFKIRYFFFGGGAMPPSRLLGRLPPPPPRFRRLCTHIHTHPHHMHFHAYYSNLRWTKLTYVGAIGPLVGHIPRSLLSTNPRCVWHKSYRDKL